MHYSERSGAGFPVIFLHGFCQSSAYWEPTLDRLASAGRTGLAPDLPGFAGSAKLHGPYTMKAYADALARFLDAREIPRVVLVGGSMGGVVAQQFALRHPERLVRLLLVATGAFTADPETALSKADSLASGRLERGDDRSGGGEIFPPAAGARGDRPPSPHCLERVAAGSGRCREVECAHPDVRVARGNSSAHADHSGPA